MKFLKPLILITAIIASTACSSDDKDGSPGPLPEVPKTVVYLIRHAEKADATADPNLSPEGTIRAQNWASILGGIAFGTFYSTNYNRTRQTIQPAADANGKTVTIYDPSALTLEAIITAHPGKNMMVVGHSNTIPQIINAYLDENVYPDMAETEFGNLYKVTVQGKTVTHEMTVHN